MIIHFLKFFLFVIIITFSYASASLAECSPKLATDCSNETLCKFATTIRKDKIVWVMEKDYFVQAKRRNLSCDVGKSSNNFKPSGSYVKYNKGKLVNYFCGVEFFKKPSKYEIQRIQRELISKNLLIGESDGKPSYATCNAFQNYTNNILKLIDNKYTKKQHNLLIRSRMTSMLNMNKANDTVFKPIVKSFDAPCKTNKNYIKSLQSKLKKLGHYGSTVDGIFGNGTANAYTKFENILGNEVATLDGCLNGDESKWLDLHIKAQSFGFTCAIPQFDNDIFDITSEWFLNNGFYKINGFSEPQSILSPTGKYIFASAIISFETSVFAGKLKSDLSKNCNLDNSETNQIVKLLNKEDLKSIKVLNVLNMQNAETIEVDIKDDKLSKVINEDKVTEVTEKNNLSKVIEVSIPIECSIETIKDCSKEQLCNNSIETLYGITSFKDDNNPFVNFVEQSEFKCNYQNVLDIIQPKTLLKYLENFVEESGNIFDIKLALKLEKWRALGGSEDTISNSIYHNELLTFLKDYKKFEHYVVDGERKYKSNQKLRLTKEKLRLDSLKKKLEIELNKNKEELVLGIKRLTQWALDNILNENASNIAKLVQISENIEVLTSEEFLVLKGKVEDLENLLFSNESSIPESKICSVQDLEYCSHEELCLNAVKKLNGISSLKSEKNVYVSFIRSNQFECSYHHVTDSLEPVSLITYVENFIEEKGNIFDMKLALILERWRTSIGSKEILSSSPAHKDLLVFLKGYPKFEEYVANSERKLIEKENINKKQNQDKLELRLNKRKNRLLLIMKKLEEWANSDILNLQTPDIIRLVAKSRKIDDLSTEELNIFQIKLEKLYHDVFLSKILVDETNICSATNLENCSERQICENSIETLYGISALKAKDDPYVLHAEKNQLGCYYRNVLGDLQPSKVMKELEKFIEENGNIFDLDLTVKLENWRSLKGTDAFISSETYHSELLLYLQEYKHFESYVVKNERRRAAIQEFKFKENKKKIASQIKILEGWAKGNILNIYAPRIVKFAKKYKNIEGISRSEISIINTQLKSFNDIIFPNKKSQNFDESCIVYLPDNFSVKNKLKPKQKASDLNIIKKDQNIIKFSDELCEVYYGLKSKF